jgi:putative sigma-54 modulation protein
MQIDMTFKHMEASEAVRTYATEKSEKLKKYFDGKVHVTWNFVVEKQEHVAHCHLVGNRMDYFGEARTTEMHASIEDALDKVEKQIRKHKEVVTKHH